MTETLVSVGGSAGTRPLCLPKGNQPFWSLQSSRVTPAALMRGFSQKVFEWENSQLLFLCSDVDCLGARRLWISYLSFTSKSKMEALEMGLGVRLTPALPAVL